MSANSAKRYGIPAKDPEVEQRIRRAEIELEKRQVSNFEVEQKRRGRQGLPRVTGLRLDNNIIGGISVTWNPLDADINRYDLEISTKPSFSENKSTFKTNETQFVFPNSINPDDTYYIRVRGVGTRAQAGLRSTGNWSATLNTATGQATFNNVQAGAANNITTFTQTSGFDPPSVNPDTYIGPSSYRVQERFDVGELDIPVDSETIIFAFTKFDLVYSSSNEIQVKVLVDGTAQQAYDFNLFLAGGDSSGRLTVPGLGFPQFLKAGIHKFSFEINYFATSGGTDSITPIEFTVVIWEQRR